VTGKFLKPSREFRRAEANQPLAFRDDRFACHSRSACCERTGRDAVGYDQKVRRICVRAEGAGGLIVLVLRLARFSEACCKWPVHRP
jgi:hypothetical protein